jgi:hypothetical protein
VFTERRLFWYHKWHGTVYTFSFSPFAAYFLFLDRAERLRPDWIFPALRRSQKVCVFIFPQRAQSQARVLIIIVFIGYPNRPGER